MFTTTGLPTGGIYGFLRSLYGLIKEGYTDIVITFDGGHSSRRKQLYPEYKIKHKFINLAEEKAHKETTDRVIYSGRMLDIILESLGFRKIRIKGIEGDDLVYVLAKYYGFENCIVCSDDRGLLQMISFGTSVYRQMKGEFYSPENFEELVGFNSQYYLIYKSIIGHAADNVLGVKDVGETTALQVIKLMTEPTFENLKSILSESSNTRMKKLYKGIDIVERNMKLVDLSKEEISQIELNNQLSKPLVVDFKKVQEIFNILEISSLNSLLTYVVANLN
jgi:DNA polymerase-1